MLELFSPLPPCPFLLMIPSFLSTLLPALCTRFFKKQKHIILPLLNNEKRLWRKLLNNVYSTERKKEKKAENKDQVLFFLFVLLLLAYALPPLLPLFSYLLRLFPSLLDNVGDQGYELFLIFVLIMIFSNAGKKYINNLTPKDVLAWESFSPLPHWVFFLLFLCVSTLMSDVTKMMTTWKLSSPLQTCSFFCTPTYAHKKKTKKKKSEWLDILVLLALSIILRFLFWVAPFFFLQKKKNIRIKAEN